MEDAGIAFIGPQPEVIDGLGDKVKARAVGMLHGYWVIAWVLRVIFPY